MISLSDREEKMEGLWCDFCGKKHAGRCEKTYPTPSLEPSDKDWEKEFDERFPLHEVGRQEFPITDGLFRVLNKQLQSIKLFISKTLASQKTQLIEEIEGRIEKMKGKCNCPKESFPNIEDWPGGQGICAGCDRFVIEEGCVCGMVRIEEVQEILKENE